MKLVNDAQQWTRLDSVNAPDGPQGTLKHVGWWMDQGTNEDMFWVAETRTMYRKRWWTGSSVMGAGEVWFRLDGGV